ncbi:MAG: peptide chain release factor N(5)-glutamine methyltransferase [Thermodesulfobacteriota bacterium]
MPSDNPPRKILEVLRLTTDFFRSHEVEGPRVSAELLLAHALKTERLDLYLRFDQPLSSHELDDYRELVRRRLRREPVAYITGAKGFWNLTLNVTRDVLIPRPDTECLVENALADLSRIRASLGRSPSVLELATGSGAVILSLAADSPAGRFFASDISPAALRVAGENARRCLPDERVVFFASDWFGAVKAAAACFDMIVVNPPYIPTADIPGLEPEIRDYEPRWALDGGSDGLDHIRHIIVEAGRFLTPGGLLMMEIGWDQQPRIQSLAEESAWCRDVSFSRDLAGHDRVARLRKQD